jgi:DNA-binding NtrC family response regulator
MISEETIHDLTTKLEAIKVEALDLLKSINDHKRHLSVLILEPTYYNLAGKTLEQIEKDAITSSLLRNNFNQLRTASELNIGRVTLYRKIKEYQIATKGTL